MSQHGAGPLNVAALHEWLQREHEYDGSLRSVEHFVAAEYPPPPVRARRRVQTPPGAQAQVDWAQFPDLLIGGQRRSLNAFHMVLAYSRHDAIVWMPAEDQLCWLAGHNGAFTRLGGIPAVVRVDNTKAAVSRGAGPWGELKATYRRYALAARFHIDPCQPYSPEHKGKVERAVRTQRWTHGPDRRSWDSVEQLQAFTDAATERSSRARRCPANGGSVWCHRSSNNPQSRSSKFPHPSLTEETAMDVENDVKVGNRSDAIGSGPPLQGRPGPALGSGATVAGDTPVAEANVLAEQQWRAIHERRAAGLKLSRIAREMDLDRKTVRSALRRKAWLPYRRLASPRQLLDAHRDWLEARAPQVNYSAQILYQELKGERGFVGGYKVVQRAVRPLRAIAEAASLTQRRFESAPGEQAQCDWGQVTVRLAGVRATLHVFVMTLGYSRRGFAMAFERERLPDLLAAHEAAFAHFGGRCEHLLYDHMRTVVLGTSEGKPKLNPRFAAFAAHWGFHVRLCQPYRAQTKGKVESGVKYVKRNFVPGRAFRDLADFNAQLEVWQREIADLRIRGTTHEQPIVRFAAEAQHMVPTASHPSFLAATIRDRVVAEDWLVSIDGNRYSVPFTLIGRVVQVVRVGGAWQIRHRAQLVAEHTVLAGRAQLSVKPEHGPGAVARNARKRLSTPPASLTLAAEACDVEVRDLALYHALSEAA